MSRQVHASFSFRWYAGSDYDPCKRDIGNITRTFWPYSAPLTKVVAVVMTAMVVAVATRTTIYYSQNSWCHDSKMVDSIQNDISSVVSHEQRICLQHNDAKWPDCQQLQPAPVTLTMKSSASEKNNCGKHLQSVSSLIRVQKLHFHNDIPHAQGRYKLYSTRQDLLRDFTRAKVNRNPHVNHNMWDITCIFQGNVFYFHTTECIPWNTQDTPTLFVPLECNICNIIFIVP